MSNNMPWFRFYSETLSDRKIAKVCTITGQPKMAVVGVWTILLSMANDSPERGKLLISEDFPITLDDITFECGEDCGEIIDAFVALKMLSLEDNVYRITNWDNRQFNSDNSTDRVKRYRDRKKSQKEPPGNAGETFQEQNSNVTVTPPESDTESESDTDNYNYNMGVVGCTRDSLRQISTVYEQEIGLISPIIADEIKDALETYPILWIEDAIKTAVKGNKRKWSYINGILKRWNENGRDGPPPGQIPKKSYKISDAKTGQPLEIVR